VVNAENEVIDQMCAIARLFIFVAQSKRVII